MPASIETNVGQLLADATPHEVYTRARWDGPWIQRPWLYCLEASFAAAPTLGEARLAYDFGQLLRPARAAYEHYEPLDILGHFVVVVIAQPNLADGTPREAIRWFGRIQEEPRDRRGLLRDRLSSETDPRDSLTGSQAFRALALEAELAKAFVCTSIVAGAAGAAEQTIGRAIAFNRGQGQRGASSLAAQGNAGPDLGAKGCQIFGRALAQAVLWKGSQIVRYLLAYHTAADTQGARELPWELDPEGDNDFLDWHTPPLEAEGASVKELLDRLVDRRRLAGYAVRVDYDTGQVYLRIFNFLAAPLTLEDGHTLPANRRLTTLNFDQAFDVGQALVVTSELHRVDRLRVRGALRGACFTLSALDGTLVADWRAEDETAYEAGASAEAGYASLDRNEKEYRCDRRRLEPRFERVYRYFRLPDDWDGTVKEGTGGGVPMPVNPRLPEAGAPFDPNAPNENFWQAGIRFENYLPLKTDHDYTGNRLTNGDVLDHTPAGGEAEFLRPFVALKVDDGSGAAEYHQLDKMNAVARFETAYDGGRGWSATTRMQERGGGLIVDVQHPHGAGQHVIASADFSGRPASEIAEIATDLDWRDNLLATVYWLTDQRLEILWPEAANIPPGVPVREQRIELGDDYRLDYVAPNTVVAIEGGALQRSYSGGFVRDDRPRMKALAQVAWQWYQRPRRAFSLVYRQVLALVEVGDLVTQIGAPGRTEEVNAVVTQIVYDLAEQTTSLATDFGALDLRSFVAPAAAGGDA